MLSVEVEEGMRSWAVPLGVSTERMTTPPIIPVASKAWISTMGGPVEGVPAVPRRCGGLYSG